MRGPERDTQGGGKRKAMSDYKIAIKIAGELESSFRAALKGAQSGINGLAKVGKMGATAFAASAAAIGSLAAAGINAGIAAFPVCKPVHEKVVIEAFCPPSRQWRQPVDAMAVRNRHAETSFIPERKPGNL